MKPSGKALLLRVCTALGRLPVMSGVIQVMKVLFFATQGGDTCKHKFHMVLRHVVVNNGYGPIKLTRRHGFFLKLT